MGIGTGGNLKAAIQKMTFASKAQFNMFKSVASGIRKVSGLTPKQAAKDLKGKTDKGLPKKVKAGVKVPKKVPPKKK